MQVTATIGVGLVVLASCAGAAPGAVPPIADSGAETSLSGSAPVDAGPGDSGAAAPLAEKDDCGDRDHDGVPDYCDECPDHAAQTATGCMYVDASPETIIVRPSAAFEPNGVTPSFEATMLELIVAAANKDRLKRIGIVGRALSTERDGARLAQRRAEAVKKLLLDRKVDPSKIELHTAPVGDLEDCPIPQKGAQNPCASVLAVDVGGENGQRLRWDGKHYVEPPPPKPRFQCPPPPPRCAGAR